MHEVVPGAGVGAGVGIGVYELSDILDEPPPPQALKKIVVTNIFITLLIFI